MGKSQSILDEITIASPCSADWEEMTGDERKRYCGQCKLHVFNISEMTTAEAEKLILAEQSQRSFVCLRIFRRADGTVLTSDCPVGLKRVREAARAVRSRITAVCSLLVSLLFNPAAPAQGQRRPSINVGGVADRPGSVLKKFQLGQSVVMGRYPAHHVMGGAPVYTNLPALPSSMIPPHQSGGHGLYSMSVHASLLAADGLSTSDHGARVTEVTRTVRSACANVENKRLAIESAREGFEIAAQSAAKSKVDIGAALGLVAEGNCLYYLGRLDEAISLYDSALRQIEEPQFSGKPMIQRGIVGNLQLAEKLRRQKLTGGELEKQLANLHQDNAGASDLSIVWPLNSAGEMERTEPL